MHTSEAITEGPSPHARRAGAHAPELLRELLALREAVSREAGETFASWRPGIKRATFMPSAHNLAAYLSLRTRDVRALQDELAEWGLSSLGRSESRILSTLEAVAFALGRLAGSADPRLPARRPDRGAHTLGARLLERNTRQVFGAPSAGRSTHIMVTLPERAKDDPAFVEELVARGMSSARINGSHGTHDDWRAMIQNVRAAERRFDRPCKVVMDLCGPRVRTAAVFSRDERKVLEGDRLLLRAAAPDPERRAFPFQVQCAPRSVLDVIKVGTAVAIDEGRLEARVAALVADGAVADVTHTPPGGLALKAEKGLNFPGTPLGIPSLTEKDRADLEVMLEHADIVGYSFVQERSDVEELLDILLDRARVAGRAPLGLILKVETERAVHNLPELIVAAAGRVPVGVMIARGDLGVEVGVERLAELQEELLWLAEAAHTPVIWATQVLDRLVKTGTTTRGEISDVVLAQRAECIMLNKGEFLLEALATLDDVCRRMGAHQRKKTSRLRALRAWS